MMALLKLGAFLLATSVLGSIKADTNVCGFFPDEVCASVELDLDLKDDPVFPDEEFLEKNCGPVLTEVKCLMLYNSSCSFTRKRGIPLPLQRLHDVTTEVCGKDTAVGRAYRQNIGCVNDLGSEIRDAVTSSTEELFQYVNFVSQMKPDFQIENDIDKINCIYLVVVRKKLSSLFEERCSRKARKVLHFLYEPLLEECPPEREMMPYEQLLIRFVLERAMAP